MQFLSAASVWFAAALPVILLMYILKKKYKDTAVPSHLLWNRLLREQEANRPWQKLRGRWLLFLQLLAALLLVIALMDPVRTGGAGPEGHAVLLIDRSGSMSTEASAQGQPATTRLRQSIDRAVEWLEGQQGSRPVSIVVTGAEPEVLVTRERDRRALREKLNEIVPFYGRSDNAAALSFADSLHGGEKDGETLIFTDGEWADSDEAASLKLSVPATQRSANPDVADSVPFENGSILSFGLREEPRSPGHQFATVTVRNDSERARTYKIDLYAFKPNGEQSHRADMTVKVEAGAWQSVDSKLLPPADYYKAVLHGEADRIAVDNAAFQFPEGARTGRALLVTDGNLFLEKALALAGVQTVKVSSEQPVPEGELARELDWIVLDGAFDRLKAEPGWSEWLQTKPLWVIDHPEEGDPGSRIPKSTEVVREEHAVASYITLEDTHIGRLYVPDADEIAWGEPILSYGSIPAIYAGTSQGRPQLRFTFNLQDTDLPLRPEFPILIVQAAEWMNGSALPHLGSAVASSRTPVALQADTERAEWIAVDSSDLPAREREIMEASRLLDLQEDSAEAPAIPGLYKLEERNGAGDLTASRLLAVTPDMAELEARKGDQERLRLGGGQETEQLGEGGQSDAGIIEHSMIAWAAALLLALLAAEWEVYRRGHIG
ncbi:BatA and WFA domain-containing protein [Paenibacillus sp. LHD-117]|uniref:vWA domain-containing protein n=1 Tax=Paenibacillus sp. LHD-117 TaxID=3071412 RepID=UPI0027E2033D|nr:BatA and WFA domain-containing protein [Paenibacillus sp. LHD-117]MDQ6419148.1 BatA and WFA domain-containing protein [Paenibacillus sp. LHD-117]